MPAVPSRVYSIEAVRVSTHTLTQVLATAASNIAVDNLVERLAAADPKLKLVRTGHAARLLPSVSPIQQPFRVPDCRLLHGTCCYHS